MADIVPVNAAPGGGFARRLSPLRDLAAQPAVRRSLPMLGSLGALTIAGLAWYSFQSPPQREVLVGLGDADKAAVADALQSAGIPHAVDRTTGAVTVGEDQFYKARMLLAAQGLPKAAPAGDALLSALPMGASRAMEGETLRSAREADLARTIEAIEAVRTARIHLAMPEASAFLRDQAPAAASVMLTLQSGRSLTEAQVRAIGHLVASSVPGLNADQVSIVDQSGQLLSQASTMDDRSLALQAQIEDRARRALDGLLAPVVGANNFTAEIHADLDLSESQATRETYPKDDRALRSENGTKTTNSTTPPAVGIPGTLSNQPPTATSVTAAPGLTLPTAPGASPSAGGGSEENYTRAFDVGREISVTHQPVGRLRRMTVAVALRDVKGAKARTAADIAAIENLVKSAVGFDPARGDLVAVIGRPFVDATAEPVAFYDRPWFMLALRQGGALVAALVAFLLIGRPLLKMLRRPKATARHEAVAQGLLDAVPSAAAPKAVTLDMIEAAPSYEARANLVRDFVRQDPTKAAAVVKQLMADRTNG